MNIRLYQDSDLTATVDFFIRVFNAPPWNDQWTLDSASQRLIEICLAPGFRAYVGIRDGGIIAACLGRVQTWWNRKEYYIEEMLVDQDCQGEGLGTLLLQYVQQDVMSKGIQAITLITERNLPASKFYQKNGFYTADSFVLMKKKF